MANLIARLRGIITSVNLENPTENLKLRDPEKYVELKKEDKLPQKYYFYTIDQHTGEGKPLQFNFKEHDLDLPVREPFTEFDENCLISSWSFNNRHGLSVKITDYEVKKVSISFDDQKTGTKFKKVG